MTETQNDEFEDVLGALLDQRAAKANVTPDLEAILTDELAPGSEPQLVRTHRHWLLAAAALLVFTTVGAAVARNLAGNDAQSTAAGPPRAEPSAMSEFLHAPTRPPQDGELILWLEPNVTSDEVNDIVAFLENGGLATNWFYVDTEQTWAEFASFWADNPEVLDAVEPHQLPTSLRLTTTDPVGLVTSIDRANFPSVRSIQGANFTGTCYQRLGCVEIVIDQEIEDLQAQGATGNGSLVILEDRTITEYEAGLLRTRLQACIDMIGPDDDGNEFVAGINDDLRVIPYSGTAQTQLDQLERCTDESVGDLPSIYRLQRAEAAMAVDATSTIGVLMIDRLGLDVEVVEGTTTRGRVGHYAASAPIGSNGNAAIAGPRSTYGSPFASLDELTPGDEIRITTIDGSFVYLVREQPDGSGHLLVDPDDTDVLGQTERPMLTLTSTHPEFSDRKRIIVQADLQGEPLDIAFTTHETQLAD